jgi:predicted GTPase
MTPKERYQKLEQLLNRENPVLLDIIQSYKDLDKVGHRTGLLTKQQSYAEHISWWPLISVLGTFSAGKSSFINHYVGKTMQTTGNQAIDDKFTVICHGNEDEVTTLPGLALDSDPRFPFYGMSQQIDKVELGEGSRIDSYLQLKTTQAANLRGKILIDSPGFDADSQRDATLRLTNHIIDLSDLVLVFFDARHPEPGAMRDTLQHLVASTRKRHDSDKVLYILNQIDTAAKEDNLEEIIGSWQRALSSQGLIGGNFYAIYNESAAAEFSDQAVCERFKRKRDTDIAKIFNRMDKVSIERSYRIARALENIANEISQQQIPKLSKELEKWRKRVLIVDGIVFTGLALIIGFILSSFGAFDTPISEWSITVAMQESALVGSSVALASFAAIFSLHHVIRHKLTLWQQKTLRKQGLSNIANALSYSTRYWRGMFYNEPRGWGRRSRKLLAKISSASKSAIQKLNDQFTNPSGSEQPESKETTTTQPDNQKPVTVQTKPSVEINESGENREKI